MNVFQYIFTLVHQILMKHPEIVLDIIRIKIDEFDNRFAPSCRACSSKIRQYLFSNMPFLIYLELGSFTHFEVDLSGLCDIFGRCVWSVCLLYQVSGIWSVYRTGCVQSISCYFCTRFLTREEEPKNAFSKTRS